MNKKVISLITVLAILLSFPVWGSQAQAQAESGAGDGAAVTYYVDSLNGDDSKAGTAASSAWRSLDKVNGLSFSPGDRILFKRGCAWEGQLNPRGSGAAGSPIIIDSYGSDGGAPVINGNGVDGAAVLLRNQQYWEICNLEITNQAEINTGERQGVILAGDDGSTLQHIYLKNLYIHDIIGYEYESNDSGIFCWVSDDTCMNDIQIDSCVVEGCTGRGIFTISYNFGDYDGLSGGSFFNTVITNNILDHNGGDGITLSGAYGARVEHNVSRYSHSGWEDSHAVGMFPIAGWNNVFQYNESYLTQTTMDGQGFDCDWSALGTVMQYNYSHDNAGGFMLVCSYGDRPYFPGYNRGSVIRYNISQNDRNKVFTISGPVQGAKIYNNTIYLGPAITGDVIRQDNWGGYPDRIAYYNNIFYVLNDASYLFGQSTNTLFDYNCFYGIHPDSEPDDAHKITADPGLVGPGTGGTGRDSVSGYRLQPDSPLISAGMPMEGNGGLDYWGNPVSGTGKPNIGADNSYNRTEAPEPGETVFRDDFEDGDSAGWMPSAGDWVVSDDGAGNKAYAVTAAGGITAAGDNRWTDYSVSADVVPSFEAAGKCHLFFRYNGDPDNAYFASMSDDGVISINRTMRGTTIALAEKDFSVTSGQKYNLKAEVTGSTIKLYVDGVLRLTATDACYTSGWIAIGAYRCPANFDNITVTDLSAQVQELFRDDFESGDGHWTADGEVWKVRTDDAGNNVYSTDPSGSYVNYSDLSDFILTVDETPTYFDPNAGASDVFFRCGPSTDGYFVSISNSSNSNTSEISLVKNVGEDMIYLDSEPHSFKVGQKYTLKIVAAGSHLEVYVNDEKVLEAEDSAYTSGCIAFNSWRSMADFDNLKVSDLDGNMIFSEDFETNNINYWKPEWGSWSIAADDSGNMVYRQSSYEESAHSKYIGPMPGGISCAGENTWESYAVLADVTPVFSEGKGSVNLYFRYTDAGSTYFASLNNDDTISLSKLAGGVLSDLASRRYPVTGGQKYNVKIVTSGSAQYLYINGVKLLTATDAELERGKIGLSAWNSSAVFDNVTVFPVKNCDVPPALPFEPISVTATHISGAPQIEKIADWIQGSDTAFEIKSNEVSANDCSGTARLNWEEENFYLSLIVRDDSHVQDEVAANNWRYDSIQIAVDPVRSTAPGALGYTEFNYALSESGEILAYGNGVGEDAHDLPGDSVQILRDEEEKTTTYVVAIPWSDIFRDADRSVIGEGGLLGFSMLINDVDRNSDGSKSSREMLEFNSGIGSDKDPALYGDLTLAASSEEPGPGGRDALFARESVSLSGSSKIIGDVATHATTPGSIRFAGTAGIEGNLWIGEGADWTEVVTGTKPNPKDSVTGEILPCPVATEYPMPRFPEFPDPEDKGDLIAGWWPEGPYVMEESGTYGKIDVTKELTVNVGEEDIEIVTNNLSVSGSGRIVVNRTGKGRLILYVTDRLQLSGSGAINPGGSYDDVYAFHTGAGPVQIGGSTVFNGSVYTRDADVALLGSGSITGHIITGGSSVNLSGNPPTVSRVIYAPEAALTVSGSARGIGTVIVRSITLSGSAQLQFDDSMNFGFFDFLRQEGQSR